MQLHATFLSIQAADTYGGASFLRLELESLLGEIAAFRSDLDSALPATAISAIDTFVESVRPLLADHSGSTDSRQQRVWSVAVRTVAFQARLSYLLSDVQQDLRLRSEQAFAHLQRAIVADPSTSAAWGAAFREGETKLERLGAAHLLLHGVWGFKVATAGEQTDLVFPEQPFPRQDADRASIGLVLTEWKRATLRSAAAGSFERGRAQAQLYARGGLAGIELRAYRYVVVVSEDRIEVPQDVVTDGVTYRNISIAIRPGEPSDDAPRRARSSRRRHRTSAA